MTTRSTIDGWLKSPAVKPLYVVAFMVVLVAILLMLPSAPDRSAQQADHAIELAKYWQAEALKWREIAGRSTLQAAMTSPEASKCDGEKCVNVCTGEPAMKVRP
jgi:hypothetical protein